MEIQTLLMQLLNLPKYPFRIKENGKSKLIFDFIRKKFVALTPEEWVRQNFIQFLVHSKKYPPALIAVEMLVVVNGLKQRSDIVIHDRSGAPIIIIECKAPKIKITQQVFNQAARYNLTLKVKYLVLTNGINHFCAQLDYHSGQYTFLKMIPDFENGAI